MSYAVSISITGAAAATSVAWTPTQDSNGNYFVDVSSAGIDASKVNNVSLTKNGSPSSDYTFKALDPTSGTLRSIQMEEGGGGN